MLEKQLLKIIATLEDVKRRKDSATGALLEVQKEIKKVYGCKSLKEANVMLEQMRGELKADEQRLERELDELEKEMESCGVSLGDRGSK